ncbi:MAG: DUF1538 domain-containing protein [Gammaproteobacteria bacterium]|nr:DUF1538 domain-containing protein [Gammaproteobacteria bacterium]
MAFVLTALQTIGTTILDVLPVLAFLFAFQLLVIRRPLPDLRRVMIGAMCVIVGLALFLLGLEQALFPVGRLMAEQLTDPELVGKAVAADGTVLWQQFVWVYAFAFLIGFSTTIAEPSLLAVAIKANEVSGGSVHVWGLRVAVALGVAIGVALGCYRIVTGTPLHYYIMAGYVLVVVQTAFAPKLIVPLAYDSGGVTTSTVTVPLVTALGLGLAENIPGRSALLDGFGLVAFASLFPIMAVLAYGQLAALRERGSGSE